LRTVCPQEEIELRCPPLVSAIKRGDYEEVYWSVTDPNDESRKASLGYCWKLDCTRYKSLGIFEKRIEIRNPVGGNLFVKQLWKNDLLKYTCNVQRKRKKRPLFDHIKVSSSVDCLTAYAGQDLKFNQASEETIRDMWWYIMSPDGKKQTIAYCNSTTCNKTCPECLPRLELHGMSLILRKVTQADRGLQLQRRIEPDITHGTAEKPIPRVYTAKIKDVLEFPSDSNRTNLSTPSRQPTRNSTDRVHGTNSSADGRVLTFSAVLISLLIEFFN